MDATPPSAHDVPDAPAFDAWRLPVLDRDRFDALDARARLEHLAALALLAPTTHNTVPQRMRLGVGLGTIDFALDRRAILPQSDAGGRQATVSLGAAIENACTAAEAYGWRARVGLRDDVEPLLRPLEDGADPIVPVATLTLDRDGPPSSRGVEWIGAMLRRKMVRAEFDERVRLEPSLGNELSALAAATRPALTLHLLSDAPTLLALGKFQELADSTVINRAGFARELAEWLVENESDTPLGMRGREFGLSDTAARRFREGLAGRGPLLPDEAAAFAKAGNIGMRSSSAVAVITVARDDVAHRIAAGRAFESMALRLTLAGLCVAMHAGITEVEAPNMALRGRLRTLQRPTVVFRIGRPLHVRDGERPHSSRPALDAVLY